MSNHPTPPLDVVALDVETTSLLPNTEIWEFGAVRRFEGGEHSATSFMLANPNLRDADPQALRVGRFYERHPGAYTAPSAPVPGITAPGPLDHIAARLAITFAERDVVPVARPRVLAGHEFARQIARFTHGAVLLVNNPAFDVPRLERLLRHHGIAPGWHYRPCDVVALAAGRLAALQPDLEDVHGPTTIWGSELVSDLLGVRLPVPDERHTALGDARWVLRLFDAARGQANPAGGEAHS